MPSNAPNVRRCAACREHAPKSDMIRICRSSDGTVFVDSTGKADGRGVWVHKNAACVNLLTKKKALNAAFGCAVPAEIYEELNESI